MSTRLIFQLALFIAIFLHAIDSRAQTGPPPTHDRTSSLSWIRMPGAESCVPTQELARDVEVRLARTVFVSASQADVSIEGRIDRKGNATHWHATIILRDSKGATIGTRELDRVDASCSGMNEQLALVIAVMIDPDAALAHHPTPTPTADQNPTPPPPTTTSTPPPPPIEKQNPPPPPETKPTEARPQGTPPSGKSPSKRAEPWFFEGSAAAFGEIGMTPNPGVGLGVSTFDRSAAHSDRARWRGGDFFRFDRKRGWRRIDELHARLLERRFVSAAFS